MQIVSKKMYRKSLLAMIHWRWFIGHDSFGHDSLAALAHPKSGRCQFPGLQIINNNFIIERHKLAIYSGNKKSKKSFSHLWSKSSCEVCYSKLMIFWDEIQFIFDSKKPSRYETTVRSSQSEDGVAPSRYGNWSSWWTEQSNCLQ